MKSSGRQRNIPLFDAIRFFCLFRWFAMMHIIYSTDPIWYTGCGLNDRGTGVWFPTGIFLFAASSIPVLRAHPSPFSIGAQALSPEVKRQRCTPTQEWVELHLDSSILFMAWWLITNRDNFIIASIAYLTMHGAAQIIQRRIVSRWNDIKIDLVWKRGNCIHVNLFSSCATISFTITLIHWIYQQLLKSASKCKDGDME
jgi:hypothetical protein